MTITITITAFERSPDGGSGLAWDTRVRWALEGVAVSYEARPVSFRQMKEPAHLALHPFGQIPTYEGGDLALFESDAIVLHIAERHAGLLPDDADARARAIAWMFAAVSTVELPIRELVTVRLLEAEKTLEQGTHAAGRGSYPQPPGTAFRPAGRCRLARRVLQRRRSDDSVGAAPVETVGHSGQASETGRLCGQVRSASCLPTRLQGPTGRVHRQTADLYTLEISSFAPDCCAGACLCLVHF